MPYAIDRVDAEYTLRQGDEVVIEGAFDAVEGEWIQPAGNATYVMVNAAGQELKTPIDFTGALPPVTAESAASPQTTIIAAVVVPRAGFAPGVYYLRIFMPYNGQDGITGRQQTFTAKLTMT